MSEKRKFKVLWFCGHGQDMKRVACSCFETAAEELGADYDKDFEHEFVWPLVDREAARMRVAAGKYDLVMIDAFSPVADVANEFCADWTPEQLQTVVLWQVHPNEEYMFIPKLRVVPEHIAFARDDFEDWVRVIVNVLAAAKR